MKKAIIFVSIFLTTFCFSFCQSYPAENDKEFDNGSNIVFPEIDNRLIENLDLLGKLWGFLKYNHPEIGDGKYNWDYELFRILPEYLKVNNNKQRDNILLAWINKYGKIPVCKTCKKTPPEAYLKPDSSWVEASNMSKPLKNKIQEIYNNRHQGKHYYISIDNFNPTFLNEKPYVNLPYSDQGFRLLTLYRFWNIIQYFSPYRNMTDKKWNNVLVEYIPKFLNAKGKTEYELTALQLIAEMNDTHAGLMPIGKPKGKKFAPFRVRFIENQLVVIEFVKPQIQESLDIKVGDVITHISGKSVKQIVDSLGKYYPASNNASKLRDIAFNILRSDQPSLDIQYNSDSQEKNILLQLYQADSLNLFPTYDEKCYKILDGNIGYITLRSIKNSEFPIIIKTLLDTRGIIIDFRNGVSEYVPYSLGSLFVSKKTPFAKVTSGNIDNPGEFQFAEIPPINPWGDKTFMGKLVIIVNENTQSQGEFTAMALRAGANTTVIGSTTAGTDGGARQIILPGNLKTMITGYGIFYPNGKQTQRIGIVPDITVNPTIEGIKNGKDEVLEKAIKIIKNE